MLCHLVGPEAKLNGEVLSAASDIEQAGIIYKMAKQMVELDPELSQLCKCIDTTKRIVCYHLGAVYKSLTADARRQHGGNPIFCIYDELAQAKDRELWDVLSTAFGAQEEGLMLVISTQSPDPNSIMSELVDDALAQMRGELHDPQFYGRVFMVPENPDDATFGFVPGVIEVDGKRVVDIYDEENWYLANPALGDFKVLADMRARASKAKRSPAAEAAFRNLHLNQRVDGAAAFVNRADWLACQRQAEQAALEASPMSGGLDLSSRTDLTAFVGCVEMPDGTVATRAWFWTPADTLEDRAKSDKAPYDVWRNEGRLIAVPGSVVSFAKVASDLIEIARTYNLKRLAFDRWRIDEFKRELLRAGAEIKSEKTEDEKTAEFVHIGDRKFMLVNHGQGFKDMAPSVDNLEELILNHKLTHDGNPVLTYCISNVKLSRDEAGNRKFDKKRANRRIDGAVALAMGVSAIVKRDAAPTKGPSVYESRGVIAF